MKPIIVNDRVSYTIESRRIYTDNGYLIVPGRVARTGVQQYLASELQLPDRDPNEIINVYRPPEEVFNPKSLASYDGSDITIEHPDQLVNSETYAFVSKGVVRGSGREVDDFVECELVIKDNGAISAVHSGKVQLSAGYSAIYEHTPGFIAPDGTVCEFTQRDIMINHVALVDRARAGVSARIFDNETGKTIMSKVTIDSGKSVDIADAATATLLQDTIDRLMTRVKDAEETEKELAEAEKKVEELEEKVEELEESTGDSAIQKRVNQLVKLKDSAKKIAGRKFSSDSLSPMEIMIAALKVARPRVAWDSKSEAYVHAAFDAEEERKEESEDDDDDDDRTDNSDSAVELQRRQLASDGARGVLPHGKKSGYQTYTDSLRSSWKKNIGSNK